MPAPLYMAIDLGAGSGRVFLADVSDGRFDFEEVYRFQYPPREHEGRLRWDFELIFGEIKKGLSLAGERARGIEREIGSIGVDSWAVDYGLLDGNGELVADPVCYRDDRTKDTMERAFELVPRPEIFERTGIQFQNFNTAYQLISENGEGHDEANLLLLPDLINYLFTGQAVSEYTNATTTQLVSAETGEWDEDLITRLGIDVGLFQPIVREGSNLGLLDADIAVEVGLDNVRVVAPATHDTASAVAAAPLDAGTAYISSGTWSLIGTERSKPITSEAAERLNFTNEGGVEGKFRFLKNVMGLWIFESCRREWQIEGYDTIMNAVAAEPGFGPRIFPDDERFLNPPSMIEALRTQLAETGQQMPDSPAGVAKMIFDSLAFRYASVVRSISELTGETVKKILIVGGGGKNRYLNQMTANATGLPVEAGLPEATVVGNVLVQAIAAGRFESIAEVREYVREKAEFETFAPESSAALSEAAARYPLIEEKYAETRHA